MTRITVESLIERLAWLRADPDHVAAELRKAYGLKPRFDRNVAYRNYMREYMRRYRARHKPKPT